MKIKIYNSNNQVQNAFVNITNQSLNIYVNFKDRDVYHYWVHGPGNLELCVHEQEPMDDDYTEPDRVLFIPENSEEEDFLACIHFDLINKDQLWTMFVRDNVYNDGNNVGNVDYVDSIEEYKQLMLDNLRKYHEKR